MSRTDVPSFTPADLETVAGRWNLDPGLVGRLGPAIDRMRAAYGRVRDLATEDLASRAPEPPPVAVTRVPPGPDNP
ncbi:hypothetical protein ACFQ08_40730, partial [Streptosporangium algeriense]